MPEIVTECPHCRRRQRVDPLLEGQTAACAHCGQPFRVVEQIIQPERYVAARNAAPEPEADEILAPPVVTPSWRETPVLRTSFSGNRGAAVHPAGAPQQGAAPAASSFGPDEVSPGWGWRLASMFHTYAGGLAILIGLIALAGGLDTGRPGTGVSESMSRDALLCWGLLLMFCGVISITLGRTLAVVSRMAAGHAA